MQSSKHGRLPRPHKISLPPTLVRHDLISTAGLFIPANDILILNCIIKPHSRKQSVFTV